MYNITLLCVYLIALFEVSIFVIAFDKYYLQNIFAKYAPFYI